MLVLVSVLDNHDYSVEVEVSELNFELDNQNFWMRCVMGDDWLQRVNSSLTLEFNFPVVRITDNIAFVVCNNKGQAERFCAWLNAAERKVQEGFLTMRG